MKSFLTVILALFCAFNIQAQETPTPKFPTRNKPGQGQGNGPSSSTYISSFTWNKVSANDYELFDNKGSRLNDLKFLSQLSTDSVAVLHRPSRSILILPDFDSVSEGGPRNGYVLKRDISPNFYLTNPKSYITYVNDESYSPEVTNVDGSYVAYVSELDKTYLEKDIRSFPDWGAMDLIELPTAPDNTYWYRDRANKEYGIIIRGETMKYSNVTSEMQGNDRIVKDNGREVYRLVDYENTGSFVFKPVSTNVSGGGGSTTTTATTGCVRGDCDNGFGKYQYDNGYYDGFWKNGLKEGYGLYAWDSGGTYVGNWQNDDMRGYGVYTADNDDLIKGLFNGPNLDGLGVTRTGDEWKQGIFSNGSLTTPYNFYGNNTSSGCTIGDCNNQYGKMEWDNGDTFVGFFKNGALYMGTYSFASGDKYSGQFNQNNEFDGMGRFWFADGTYYGGSWRNGRYHGDGYYSDSDAGELKVGEFNNGSFVRSKN